LSDPVVTYGSAALRAKFKADTDVAEEIRRQLSSLSTPGFRGTFRVTFDSGRIVRVVMETSIEVRV
jgi:hypothetical protein